MIALSPCCYHKITEQTYHPRSNLGRTLDLKLTRQQLHLPSAFQMSDSHKVSEQRRTELAYRCGLDQLLRDALANREYTPMPSAPRSWFKQTFREFCQRMLARMEISIPKVDFARYEEAGIERAYEIRAMSMARTPFKRAIELWVVADRGLWISDCGWNVELRAFCDADISPRNLIILGLKPNQS